MDNIKEVENIKLAGTLELEPCYKKNNSTLFYLKRDNKRVYTFPAPKTIYAKINETEDIKAVDKEKAVKDGRVVKITTEDIIKHALNVGLLRDITTEDIKIACEIIDYDRILEDNVKLTTIEEKQYTQNGLYGLTVISKRFYNAVIYCISHHMEVFNSMLYNYLNTYPLHNQVIAYSDFGDGYDNDYNNIRSMYGFPDDWSNATPVYSNKSLTGYNAGSVEVEENNKYKLYNYTEAIIPDSWQGMAVIVNKDNKTTDYLALIYAGETKSLFEHDYLVQHKLVSIKDV